MASDTGSFWLLIVQAATAALLTFALSLPANAQFWGNSWGWQQPRQPYNPYGGGFGRDPQWDYWGYRQRERAPTPRLRERPREVEKEQPPDYSYAPPATPREDATVKIVVMGDANADWLAYGLEEAFSEKPEISIVRKHRTDSGLIRYESRRDTEWPQVVREGIAADKPKFIVMRIGNNDRQQIREKAQPVVVRPAAKAGIVYVDIWDGFVDEAGRFSPQGPDYEGQTRRLRSSDGVYFTKFGARKLAHYVEREVERSIASRGAPVALPVPVDPGPQ